MQSDSWGVKEGMHNGTWPRRLMGRSINDAPIGT